MYTGKDVVFNPFSSNSVITLSHQISDWYRDAGKDFIILHVAYSVAYKGKDDKGREQMYHSAIVTHVQPSS